MGSAAHPIYFLNWYPELGAVSKNGPKMFSLRTLRTTITRLPHLPAQAQKLLFTTQLPPHTSFKVQCLHNLIFVTIQLALQPRQRGYCRTNEHLVSFEHVYVHDAAADVEAEFGAAEEGGENRIEVGGWGEAE